MAIKSGIILFSLLLGVIAIPTPESEDLFRFFQNVYPETDSRIVGGSAAAEGAHPHMVAMTSGTILRSFSCGGSIIGRRSVLTAAHCIDAHYSFGSVSSSVRLTVGTNTWNSGGESFAVNGNATHPNYVSSLIKNDLGILYTTTAITYTPRIQPITLSFDFIGGGVNARAAGWGRISANDALSARLLEVVLPTIDGQQCVSEAIQAGISHSMSHPGVQPHIELCTRHPSGPGIGTCRGDSGSALVNVNDGTQIGIVSWGFPCALAGAPDMFVRVSAFESWLNANIRN